MDEEAQKGSSSPVEARSAATGFGSNSGGFGNTAGSSGGAGGEGSGRGMLDVNSAVFICAVASLVEFASASDGCSTNKQCTHGTYAFAIAVGVISTVICTLRLAIERIQSHPPPPQVSAVQG